MVKMLTLGIPLCALIFVIQTPTLSRKWRAIFVSLFVGIIMLAIFFLIENVYLGNDGHWWEVSPWKELIMYLIMLVGMEVSIFNAAIVVRREELSKLKRKNLPGKIPLRVDYWDMVQPALLSAVTFCILRNQIGDKPMGYAAVTIYFETGFLWQTVVRKELKKAPLAV